VSARCPYQMSRRHRKQVRNSRVMSQGLNEGLNILEHQNERIAEPF
jgi:hypothetical protein